MTEHDRQRMQKALACDRNDRASLIDAIGGLQSTDAPELVPLYDELNKRLAELDAKQPAKIDDGGPVFPEPDGYDSQAGAQVPGHSGMSLRDYFAATCDGIAELQCETSEELIGRKLPEDTLSRLAWSAEVEARLRYIYADAMLAQRQKARPA